MYLGLRFYHKDPLPYIRQTFIHKNETQRFVDDEFPVHKANNNNSNNDMAPGIITAENCLDFQNDGSHKRWQRIRHFRRKAKRNWTWMRASSILNVKCGAPITMTPCDDPRDILQGAVGNCGFCSGIASLVAGWPDFLSRAIHWDADCGAYSIRLYPNGQERYLLLDDYLLSRKDGSGESPSLHGKPSTTTDIVVRMLEKAFVKLQGSYASLDGYYKYKSLYRHPARALQLLTGASCAVEICCDTGEKDEEEKLYATLFASQGKCCRVAHCRKSWNGLRSNHGYSLLWVGQVDNDNTNANTTAKYIETEKVTKLVCLRNPHGNHSYTGNFGFGSNAWTPKIESNLLSLHEHCFQRCTSTGRITWRSQELNYDGALDDGIFFMEFSAFFGCFPSITVAGGIQGRNDSNRDVSDCVYRVSVADLGPNRVQTLFTV